MIRKGIALSAFAALLGLPLVNACGFIERTCENLSEPCPGATPGGPDSGADVVNDTSPPCCQDGSPDSTPPIDGAPEAGTCGMTRTPSEDPCAIDDALGVFLAPSGDDANAGTKAAPVKTLALAVTLAKTKAARRVYVCNATFTDPLTLTGATNDFGVSIFGGLACPGDDAGGPAAWTYVPGSSATIAPTTRGYALRVDGMTKAVRIEDVGFVARDAQDPGESSVAGFVSASAQVSLRRVTLTAGKGQPGTAGATPTTALPVASNGNGGATGGAEVTCACPNSGMQTVGGKGGTNGAGGKGLPDLGGGAGGNPALGCGLGVGGSGGAGSPAPPASPAAGANTLGTVSNAGWAPVAGAAGAAGTPGQGGGGGGSVDLLSVGGGGGCGGCGGSGATAGAGGGSSIGLLIFESAATVEAGRFTTGSAGAGGAGAPGQGGATGGTRGTGAGGCSGGAGGAGGNGGASGGGAGGVSAGLVYKAAVAPVVDTSTSAKLGTPGAGGQGGVPGTNDGKPGVAQPTLGLP